jgi:hypothetical protein
MRRRIRDEEFPIYEVMILTGLIEAAADAGQSKIR